MAVYSDIDMKLRKATDGDITKDEEFDAIENSLQNILATMKGERRMLPEFAANIWQMLFEPIDDTTARRIGSDILQAIEIWDNRIIVDNINVNANYDKNQYDIKVRFSIKDLQPEETREIEYILKQD